MNNNKKKETARRELILALIIIAVILLTQIVGTTSVPDPSSVDEDGHPVTDLTFEDLAKPGTRFGFITGSDWGIELMKYYPDGEFYEYNTFTDVFSAVNAGKIDATTAFLDQREDIESANPYVAFIDEPFMSIGFGFGMQKSERGDALLAEFNAFLKQYRESGETDRIIRKWEDPDRSGDVMGDYTMTGEKGTLRIATGGRLDADDFFCRRDAYGNLYRDHKCFLRLIRLHSAI